MTFYPYDHLSKKIKEKIRSLSYVGFFTVKEASVRKMRLVTGKEGAIVQGIQVCLYWLVDETDGIISDAKYQVFGPPVLIGFCEMVSELVLRKNYDQASRISADLVERSFKEKQPFPKEYDHYLNMLISAIDKGVHQCLDIPFAREYENTPVAFDFDPDKKIQGFEKLTKPQKLKVLEEIIDKEIRPYIELDAGGIKLIDLKGKEVIIAYEGSCTSCHASTGSTLMAIENILKTRIDADVFVTPQL